MLKVRFKVLILVTLAISFNVLAVSPKLTKAKAKMLLENAIEVSPEEFEQLTEEQRVEAPEELDYATAEETQYLEQETPQVVSIVEEANLPQDENLESEELAQTTPPEEY